MSLTIAAGSSSLPTRGRGLKSAHFRARHFSCSFGDGVPNPLREDRVSAAEETVLSAAPRHLPEADVSGTPDAPRPGRHTAE